MMLSARELTVAVGEVLVCRGLDLEVESGQCWAVLGRNGTGKTTLLHTLAGLREPDVGKVFIDQQDVTSLSRRQLAQKLGVLLQDSDTAFPSTVLEAALTGRHPYVSRWGVESEQDVAIARAALRQVDLAEHEQRLIQTLSGGERRRLDFATLLVQNPDLMILDEPVNHLDLAHQMRLLKSIRQLLSGSAKAVLMVLHDVNLAARFCDRLLMVYGDGGVEQGPTSQLLDEARLSRLYGTEIRRADGVFMAL